MSSKKMSALDRLTAADPAMLVTEEDLVRSRRKSLAVMHSDADQLTVNASGADLHHRPSSRRFRVTAGIGLVAATAAVFAGVVMSAVPAPLAGVPAPGVAETPATEPGIAPETGSTDLPPMPVVTPAPLPTVEAGIVTGRAGTVAVSTPDIDRQMTEGIQMRPDVLRHLKLGADQNGCIGQGFLFPTGTKVSDKGLVMPDGKSFSMGDVIQFGGIELESKAVGVCSDGRPLVYVEDVRAADQGMPGLGG
ncbi:hypothetical protein [Paenarthrobacter sp. NCHU4564]|uniref:hypothetical protein n=1 Tax=Paenarthrobacter sp. NCHU4564 TaxID=3451353 RepID=UPI003F948D9F